MRLASEITVESSTQATQMKRISSLSTSGRKRYLGVHQESCQWITTDDGGKCLRNMFESALKNLSSTVTSLNGAPIDQNEVALQHGDIITTGDRSFRWEYLEGSPYYRRLLTGSSASSLNRSPGMVGVPLSMLHNALGSSTESKKTPKGRTPGRTNVAAMTDRLVAVVSPQRRMQTEKDDDRIFGAGFVNSASPVVQAATSSARQARKTKTPIVSSVASDQMLSTPFEGGVAAQRKSSRQSIKTFKVLLGSNTPTGRKLSMMKPKSAIKGRKSIGSAVKQTAAYSEKKKTPVKLIKPAKGTSCSTGKKRKLDSSAEKAAKRLKLESPKTPDKKKMAALLVCHRKGAKKSKERRATIGISASRRASNGPSATPQKKALTPRKSMSVVAYRSKKVSPLQRKKAYTASKVPASSARGTAPLSSKLPRGPLKFTNANVTAKDTRKVPIPARKSASSRNASSEKKARLTPRKSQGSSTSDLKSRNSLFGTEYSKAVVYLGTPIVADELQGSKARSARKSVTKTSFSASATSTKSDNFCDSFVVSPASISRYSSRTSSSKKSTTNSSAVSSKIKTLCDTPLLSRRKSRANAFFSTPRPVDKSSISPESRKSWSTPVFAISPVLPTMSARKSRPEVSLSTPGPASTSLSISRSRKSRVNASVKARTPNSSQHSPPLSTRKSRPDASNTRSTSRSPGSSGSSRKFRATSRAVSSPTVSGRTTTPGSLRQSRFNSSFAVPIIQSSYTASPAAVSASRSGADISIFTPGLTSGSPVTSGSRKYRSNVSVVTPTIASSTLGSTSVSARKLSTDTSISTPRSASRSPTTSGSLRKRTTSLSPVSSVVSARKSRADTSVSPAGSAKSRASITSRTSSLYPVSPVVSATKSKADTSVSPERSAKSRASNTSRTSILFPVSSVESARKSRADTSVSPARSLKSRASITTRTSILSSASPVVSGVCISTPRATSRSSGISESRKSKANTSVATPTSTTSSFSSPAVSGRKSRANVSISDLRRQSRSSDNLGSMRKSRANTSVATSRNESLSPTSPAVPAKRSRADVSVITSRSEGSVCSTESTGKLRNSNSLTTPRIKSIAPCIPLSPGRKSRSSAAFSSQSPTSKSRSMSGSDKSETSTFVSPRTKSLSPSISAVPGRHSKIKNSLSTARSASKSPETSRQSKGNSAIVTPRSASKLGAAAVVTPKSKDFFLSSPVISGRKSTDISISSPVLFSKSRKSGDTAVETPRSKSSSPEGPFRKSSTNVCVGSPQRSFISPGVSASSRKSNSKISVTTSRIRSSSPVSPSALLGKSTAGTSFSTPGPSVISPVASRLSKSPASASRNKSISPNFQAESNRKSKLSISTSPRPGSESPDTSRSSRKSMSYPVAPRIRKSSTLPNLLAKKSGKSQSSTTVSPDGTARPSSKTPLSAGVSSGSSTSGAAVLSPRKTRSISASTPRPVKSPATSASGRKSRSGVHCATPKPKSRLTVTPLQSSRKSKDIAYASTPISLSKFSKRSLSLSKSIISEETLSFEETESLVTSSARKSLNLLLSTTGKRSKRVMDVSHDSDFSYLSPKKKKLDCTGSPVVHNFDTTPRNGSLKRVSWSQHLSTPSTSFDFSALKTPHVHIERFVSPLSTERSHVYRRRPFVEDLSVSFVDSVSSPDLIKSPRASTASANSLKNKSITSSPGKQISQLKLYESPKNKLADVEKLIKTSERPNPAKNKLSDVRGVKSLMSTPKSTKSPKNDLTDVRGVKTLMSSPKPQRSPKNDLSDVRGVKKLMKTPSVSKSPKNDLTNIRGFKIIMKTPRNVRSPKNDLTDVRGVKKLMKTPTIPKSPRNDLTDVRGVKRLMQSPKITKSPKNDLRDVRGVKTLLSSPKTKKSPRNDLTNVQGVKKLMRTPKTQKSPQNDLTDVRGVKKLMSTPKTQKSPQNDLTDVRGVKRLLSTPKAQKSPRNDLTDVRGVKKLMGTPKTQKSPRNDLTDVRGVKRLLSTPKAQKFPRNDLTDVRGVKKLMGTPKTQKSPRNDLTDVRGVKRLLSSPKAQKSPRNDLTDVRGVKKLMGTPKTQKSPRNDLGDVEGVKELMLTSERKESPTAVGVSSGSKPSPKKSPEVKQSPARTRRGKPKMLKIQVDEHTPPRKRKAAVADQAQETGEKEEIVMKKRGERSPLAEESPAKQPEVVDKSRIQKARGLKVHFDIPSSLPKLRRTARGAKTSPKGNHEKKIPSEVRDVKSSIRRKRGAQVPADVAINSSPAKRRREAKASEENLSSPLATRRGGWTEALEVSTRGLKKDESTPKVVEINTELEGISVTDVKIGETKAKPSVTKRWRGKVAEEKIDTESPSSVRETIKDVDSPKSTRRRTRKATVTQENNIPSPKKTKSIKSHEINSSNSKGKPSESPSPVKTRRARARSTVVASRIAIEKLSPAAKASPKKALPSKKKKQEMSTEIETSPLKTARTRAKAKKETSPKGKKAPEQIESSPRKGSSLKGKKATGKTESSPEKVSPIKTRSGRTKKAASPAVTTPPKSRTARRKK